MRTPQLIEVNYAYRGANATVQREYFLIDVVDFSQLRQFIAGLETEMRDMSEIAKRKIGR